MSKTLWIVREIDPKLKVLPLYAQFKAISLQDDNMSTAGYYHHQTSARKDNWIPLLPGYSWYAYDNTDLELFEMQSDYSLFKSARSKYDPSNKYSLPYLLGFLDNDNIAFLQATISVHYPNLFPEYQKIVEVIQHEHSFRENIDGETGILGNYNILLEKEDKVLLATKRLKSELEQTTIMPNEANLLET
ncbi:25671_t:CDS:2, partial [Gigaspora margarita]